MRFFTRLLYTGVMGMALLGACFTAVVAEGDFEDTEEFYDDNSYDEKEVLFKKVLDKKNKDELYKRGLDAIKKMLSGKSEKSKMELPKSVKGLTLCQSKQDFFRLGSDVIKELIEDRTKLIKEYDELREENEKLQVECDDLKDECNYLIDDRDELKDQLDGLDTAKVEEEIKKLNEILKGVGVTFSDYKKSFGEEDLRSCAKKVVKKLENLEEIQDLHKREYMLVHRGGLVAGVISGVVALALVGTCIGVGMGLAR